MTPEELGLTGSRLLDAQIALEVMGHSDLQPPAFLTSAIDGLHVFVPDPTGGKCYGRQCLPCYSVGDNFSAVVCRLGQLGFLVRMEWDGISATTTILKNDRVFSEVVASWIAESVCLAALDAVRSKL